MAININAKGYERRLAVVEQILHSRGLEPSNISPLAYSDDYPYYFNNYLYKVQLATAASSSLFPGTQPGTTKASGVSTLVIKLSNLAVEDMNNTNRIQNDVAVQYLVRQSMAQAGLAPLIPSIYAWAPPATTTSDDAAADEQSFGWIMSEFRSDVDLDSEFSSLEFEDKKQVLEQIAAILSAIQATKLAEDIKFGGLAFDSKGQIVSGEAPLRKGEPKDSYAELKLGNLNKRLETAAQSPVIQGWKYNGVNTRIEKFLASGGLLTGVDVHHKGLIHGDFTMNNMLFDKDTKKITAVLDFDWSSVSHPFDEFVSSLHDVGGNIAHENKKIEAAILSGDFSTPPNDLDEESTKQWEVAKAWNVAMKKMGVVSLSDIGGVDQMLDILRLQGLVSPFKLCNASMLKKIGEYEKVELRAKAEADLVEWLEKHGF